MGAGGGPWLMLTAGSEEAFPLGLVGVFEIEQRKGCDGVDPRDGDDAGEGKAKGLKARGGGR